MEVSNIIKLKVKDNKEKSEALNQALANYLRNRNLILQISEEEALKITEAIFKNIYLKEDIVISLAN